MFNSHQQHYIILASACNYIYCEVAQFTRTVSHHMGHVIIPFIVLSEIISRKLLENGGNVYDQILDCDFLVDPARNSR